MLPTRKEWTEALSERHGAELQKTFERSTVAVCGLGGLGSNIAFALARAGVGRLILIDFDRVDLTNLHRQQYKAEQIGLPKTEALAANLREIAPYVELEPHTVRVTEENAVDLLRGADVICEAFDSADAKAMLAETVLTQLPETDYITGSGMAGMESANLIRTRKVNDHFYVCGDERSDVTTSHGLYVARVMVCAAHEAHLALRLLAGETDC